ncbi:MAG: NAD(P)/FAD-dependent oxidoreductase [Nocardioidaceae bacterium]
MPRGSKQLRYDVVVIGGGHNGLVAACYLAKSGLSVLVLERLDETGGATRSMEPFTGLPAQVNSYATMMGLFPDRIIEELGLDLQLRPRRMSSFTPTSRAGTATGLLIERHEGELTESSFRDAGGNASEYDAWRSFHAEVGDFAKQIAGSMMEPLVEESDIFDRVEPETWEMLVERPISEAVESRFTNDVVRGLIASEALTNGFADLDDLAANRGYLFSAIGATSEWQVPIGGLGGLTGALERSAWRHQVELVTHAFVTKVESDGTTASVTWQADGEHFSVDCDWVLGNVAPWVLRILLGEQPGPRPEGAQLKVNMLVERLPRLRSGVSPAQAFAGSVHIAAGYDELRRAHAAAASGVLPDLVPGYWVCPTLTDPSTLGPLAIDGWHALSFHGLSTPARLFDGDVDGVRDEAVCRVLDAINAHLEEPVESLIARDTNGVPCLEAFAPQDLENRLALPGGHVNHGDLSWPWAGPEDPMDTPAQRWGVDTQVANVLVCGAGARRGGAVSGIPGHNAAMAVLEAR